MGYPVRHRRKIPFNPVIAIPSDIARINVELFKLESELDRYILSGKDYLELVGDAFSSNIHISTRLEGNPMTKKDVMGLTKGILERGLPEYIVDFPRQEVLNHLMAYLSPELRPPWNLEHIEFVHRMLMHGNDGAKPGEFRDHSAVIESSTGQELFIPAPHEHVEEELQALLDWLNSTGNSIYPVIAGTVFFHEFESIHPFGDGNGRCGRSLFHIYLQQHGLPNSKLCFIEQNIVADAEYYYELLARTDHSDDYRETITHFSKAVHSSYVDAVERFREKDLLSSDLDETTKRLLVKAKEYGYWFNLEFTKQWFEGISEYKLRTRLNQLVKRGALVDEGATRGKRYRFADPLERMMENVSRASGENE